MAKSHEHPKTQSGGVKQRAVLHGGVLGSDDIGEHGVVAIGCDPGVLSVRPAWDSPLGDVPWLGTHTIETQNIVKVDFITLLKILVR